MAIFQPENEYTDKNTEHNQQIAGKEPPLTLLTHIRIETEKEKNKR